MLREPHGDLRVVAFAATDVGRVREGNEDNLYRGSSVFAVADGMGGHQAGEVASEAALRPLVPVDARQFATAEEAERALIDAIRAANREVVAMADANAEFQGMGTTLTAVLVREGKLLIAHVGDSRAYLLRRGERIAQLTTDHTLVEQLVQEGRLSRDEVATHPQRSVITRAIGVDWDIDVDTLPPLALRLGDQVLLCSDGLSGPVTDEQIADVLERHDDGDAACRALLDAANAAGGPDNITVVLLRVLDAAEHTPPGGTAVGAGSTQDLGAVQAGTTTGGTATAVDALAPAAPDADAQLDDTLSDPAVSEAARAAAAPPRLAPGAGTPDEATAAVAPRRRRGATRPLAGLLGLTLVLAAGVGVGYWLLSRSYFVGDADGRVAIFRGLPQQVAGLPLSWVVETSDLPTNALSRIRRDRLRSGISVGSLAEGRRYVDQTLRADVEAAAERATPAPSPDGPAGVAPLPSLPPPAGPGGNPPPALAPQAQLSRAQLLATQAVAIPAAMP